MTETETVKTDGRRTSLVLLGLVGIVVLGGALRLDGLAAKTLTHTEALVPNLAWPDAAFPPARFSFYDTFWWHFHSEGHPQGYAFLMWAWTKVAGTGLAVLRLPSVVFGVGCLLLIYGIGRIGYGTRTGLLSAALLAVNGLHIYWSQYARMYVMACFLALLSTYLLLLTARQTDGRRWRSAAYVLTSWLAAYTQSFFWPVLATHALWSTLQRNASRSRYLLTLQALVVALGASSLAHTAYLGDDVSLPGPSWDFLAQYLTFGFLFEPDLFSVPARFVPPVVGILGLLLALGCLIQGFRRQPRPLGSEGSPTIDSDGRPPARHAGVGPHHRGFRPPGPPPHGPRRGDECGARSGVADPSDRPTSSRALGRLAHSRDRRRATRFASGPASRGARRRRIRALVLDVDAGSTGLLDVRPLPARDGRGGLRSTRPDPSSGRAAGTRARRLPFRGCAAFQGVPVRADRLCHTGA